jgi:hypothetical protein
VMSGRVTVAVWRGESGYIMVARNVDCNMSSLKSLEAIWGCLEGNSLEKKKMRRVKKSEAIQAPAFARTPRLSSIGPRQKIGRESQWATIPIYFVRTKR